MEEDSEKEKTSSVTSPDEAQGSGRNRARKEQAVNYDDEVFSVLMTEERERRELELKTVALQEKRVSFEHSLSENEKESFEAMQRATNRRLDQDAKRTALEMD